MERLSDGTGWQVSLPEPAMEYEFTVPLQSSAPKMAKSATLLGLADVVLLELVEIMRHH